MNRVKQLAAALMFMNVNVDDEEPAMAALNGLQSSFHIRRPAVRDAGR